MSKHRDFWGAAYREAAWIGYFGIAVITAAIAIEIHQGIDSAQLIGLVFAWLLMVCNIPVLRIQQAVHRLSRQCSEPAGQPAAPSRGTSSQRSLSEHKRGGISPLNVEEFLQHSAWRAQAQWLWDHFIAEPELRTQVRDAYVEQARNSHTSAQWERLIGQLWGRMAVTDLSLVESMPMEAMDQLVPWIAGGAMMTVMQADGESGPRTQPVE